MSERRGELQVSDSSFPNGRIVRVVGDVDLRRSPELRTRLLQVLEGRPKRLVLDLAGVRHMDSSGVGTLVEIKRLIEQDGGEVVLAGVRPRVRSVLEITQLDRFFLIVKSVDEALQP